MAVQRIDLPYSQTAVGDLRQHGKPADPFGVIVPSLLGYGFSDRGTERGFNTSRIPDIWIELTRKLGYERVAAQAGAWGADVTTLLALRQAERVIGIHLNSIPPYEPYTEAGPMPSERKQAFLHDASRSYDASGTYDDIQKTTPQTVAYGLNDSPESAWMLEKFRLRGL